MTMIAAICLQSLGMTGFFGSRGIYGGYDTSPIQIGMLMFRPCPQDDNYVRWVERGKVS